MPTTAEVLLEALAVRGVDTVFGIPGNHTIALYRGLASYGIRHLTCRHEQGAAFMADGYARATGRPGVCLLVSGPGLLNAATAIAQARADSVPLLIISAVAGTADLGMGRGTLHELPDQQQSAASVCRWSHTLLAPENLGPVLGRAFAGWITGRPGPVHLEIPLDLMEAPAVAAGREPPPGPMQGAPLIGPPAPDPALAVRAAGLLHGAAAPLILAGGGAAGAADALVRLAERLDAPVLNTVNGKGLCPPDHPLAVGGSPSLPCLRQAIAEADVLLAVGTEMAETDYDLLMAGPLAAHPRLIRLDIDPDQLLTPQPPAIGLLCDAGSGLEALLAGLPLASQRPASGPERATNLRAAIRAEHHYHGEMQAFFDAMMEAAPDAIVIGDSTRPTYYAAWQLEPAAPRRYWHSVSGFGTLGYALPAAFGAALGAERPVVALIGDGGIQFTLPELTTGAQAGLAVPVIVWHNDGYREIENSMLARKVPTESTRVLAPDFEAAARAHQVHYQHPTTTEALAASLAGALAADRPTLIEVRESDFLTNPGGDWYR